MTNKTKMLAKLGQLRLPNGKAWATATSDEISISLEAAERTLLKAHQHLLEFDMLILKANDTETEHRRDTQDRYDKLNNWVNALRTYRDYRF